MTASLIARVLFLGCLTTAAPASEPERLTKLKEGYREAIARATLPVTNTFVRELERLKLDLTRSGDLEGALAVDAELKAVRGSEAGVPAGSGGNTTASPATPAMAEEPRLLRDFTTIEAFQAWLLTTEWMSEDEIYVYTYPVPGKQKTTRVKDPVGTDTRDMTITKIGEVLLGSSEKKLMTIKSNLLEATIEGAKAPLKRTKP